VGGRTCQFLNRPTGFTLGSYAPRRRLTIITCKNGETYGSKPQLLSGDQRRAFADSLLVNPSAVYTAKVANARAPGSDDDCCMAAGNGWMIDYEITILGSADNPVAAFEQEIATNQTRSNRPQE
jgi:hypothetical protein